MEKKVTITYAEFNETFGYYVQGCQVKVNEEDAEALKNILTKNGYRIINF